MWGVKLLTITCTQQRQGVLTEWLKCEAANFDCSGSIPECPSRIRCVEMGYFV
jgi:hypothetical protein